MDDSSKDFEDQKSQAGGSLALVLPCAADEFVSFLSGLLGSPQIIENSYYGDFIVVREDVHNLYRLISQRVLEQDNGGLVSMGLTITYDDKSSVRFSSFKDFDSYAEIKRHLSTGFNLHLSYLIKFNDRSVPEKQEIDISLSDTYQYYKPSITKFQVRISHTARSWGVAVESLVAGYISTIKRVPISRIQRILGSFNIFIGSLVGLTIFVGSSIGFTRQLHRLGVERGAAAVQQIASFDQSKRLEETIKLVLHEIYAGTLEAQSLVFFVFVISFIVIAVTIGVIVGAYLEVKNGGFLLLTNESIQEYSARENENTWFFAKVVIGLVSSVLTGIIANVIFAYLVKS